jgi:hypothetical protein
VKKWIVASLMTLTAICASTGARGAAPAQGQEPVAYGGCRWYCSTTGASYTSATTCNASCAGFCDQVC